MIRASALLGLLAVAACGPHAPTGFALVGATLFDGTGGGARPNAVVVIRGGRIEAVTSAKRDGAIAQLGERLNGIQEVVGSIPIGSTKSPLGRWYP